LDGKSAVFLLDSRIVGETAPMVTIFMENLKDRLPYDAEKSVRKIYRCLCGKFLGWRYEGIVYEYKKIIKRSLNNFKPMIPEQFHYMAKWN
jgi:mevalonate kinase